MATETLQLIISVSGGGNASSEITRIEQSARSASTSLQGLNRSMNLTTDTLRFMRGALVAISFAKIFEEIGRGISTMQQIHNMLTQVTKSSQDNGLMFEKLGEAANKVRAPLEDFAKIFVNIERSSAAYKVSTNDIIKATQSMFASFSMSGLDESAIRNVSKDMREVFNLGIVQGRQFRAIVTQDQYEALLLSKYIVATGQNAAVVNKQLAEMRAHGQTPNIYEMSMTHKGAFTGADVLQANIKGASQAMTDLGKTTMTVGQAVTYVQNKWLLFLNGLDQSTGIFAVLSGWIKTIGDYLPEILLFAAAVGSLVVINFVTSAFLNFASLVGGALRFVLSPLIAIGEALILLPFRIGAASTAISTLGGIMIAAFTAPYRALVAMNEAVFGFVHYISTAIQVGMAFGQSFGGAVFSVIKNGVMMAAGAVANFAIGLVSAFAIAIPIATVLVAAWMTLKQVISDLTPTFQALIGRAKQLGLTAQDIPLIIEQGFSDLFKNWSQYEALFKALWDYVSLTFEDSLSKAFNWVIDTGIPNLMKAVVAFVWNTGVNIGNWIRAHMGMQGQGPLQLMQIGGNNVTPERAALSTVQNLLSTIGNRILQDTASHKAAVANATANAGLGGPSGMEPDEKTAERIRKATEAFRDYIAGLAPGGAVLKALASAQKEFDDAAAKGVDVQKVLSQYGLTQADVMKQAAREAAGLKTPMDDLTKMQANYAVLVAKGYMSQDEMNLRFNDAVQKAVGLKGALAELTDTQNLLNYAVQHNAITQAQATELMAKAQRQAQISAYELQNTVSGGVNAAILKRAPGQNTGATAESYAEEFLKTGDAAQEYTTKLQVLNQLLAQGQISNKSYTKSLQDVQIAYLKTQTDAVSGFSAGLLEAQKTAQDTAAQVSQIMTKLSTDITDSLTDALEGKRIDIRKLASDLGTQFLHAFINQNVTGPLMGLLGPNGPAGNAFSQALGIPFGSLFGGSGANQLGASASNPMYVALSNSLVSGAISPSALIGSSPGSTVGGPGTSTGGLFGGGGLFGLGGLFGGGGGLAGGTGTAPGATAPGAGGSGGLGGLSGGGGLLGGLFGDKGLFGSNGMLFGQQGLFGSQGFFNQMFQGNISDAFAAGDTTGMFGAGGLFGSGGAFSQMGDWLGGLMGFGTGGEFLVGGQGGVDSQLVAFRASPDETVSIRRPGEGSQPLQRQGDVHLHLHGVTDADSFKKSQTQVTSGLLTASARQARRAGKRM